MDASKIENFSQEDINKYDIVILRHPEFVNYEDEFKRIVRFVIPYVLKEGGQLVVSCYDESEAEAYFKNPKKAHFNSMIVKILYDFEGSSLNTYNDPILKNENEEYNVNSAQDKSILLYENVLGSRRRKM